MLKKWWSTLAVLLVTLCCALNVTAGSVETKDGKTIITVKVPWLPVGSDTSPNNMADVQILKEFRKDFPEIFKRKYRDKYKSNPEKYGDFDWDNVEIKLTAGAGIKVEGVEEDLLSIAGGMASDIIYINFKKSDNYISNNFMYPLDEYYDSLTPQELEELNIHEKIWPVINRRGSDNQYHKWAVPAGALLGRVLLYRKSLFDDNNIPYPTTTWTWDDMYEAAKKITDPDKGIYGLMLGFGKVESWWWISFLWSAGGQSMEYNEETDTWKCVFDSDAAVKALDFYVKLYTERWEHNGKIMRGYALAEDQAKWNRGEIGMMYGYIDQRLLATIDPEAVGMVPVPIGPGGNRGAEINCIMYGIFSQVKNPVIRDAAWEYILYQNNDKAQGIRTKILVEGGFGRFVNPELLDRYGYPEIKKLSPPGWMETFDIVLKSGQPEPYGKNSNFAYDMMTIPIQEAKELSVKDQLSNDPEVRYKQLKDILVKANERANEKMIGDISKSEMLKRRIVAVAVLVVIVVSFFFVFRKIFRIFSPAKEDKAIGGSWGFRKYMWAYLLLIPALITIFIWQYIPLIRGSYMAFYDYKIIGDSDFVGLDNFANLMFNADWWRTIYDSLRYSFLTLALTFLPPVILAIGLQEVPFCKIFLRTVYYLPAVITGIVTMVLWKQFYEATSSGLLNMIVMNIPAIGFIVLGVLLLLVCLAFANRLRFYEMYFAMTIFIIAGVVLCYSVASWAAPIIFPVGVSKVDALMNLHSSLFSCLNEPTNWLQNSSTAMLSCIIPGIWAGMGPGCLIYLAALKGIPEDYYEAADIDGATFIDKILFIVFPMLKALIIINFVGAFIGSWVGAGGMIMIMTGGAAQTEVSALHIWYEAFTYLRYGSATAMAWTLGVMLIGFTVYQLRILSKVEFKTTGKK
ncbi:MAG: extracellular solute-binding protein [Lentisphaeria bacterium]|nr:extracellular solute-binding protein [Lentisphaeria bacterium]